MLQVKLHLGVMMRGKIDYLCPECGMPNSFFLKQDDICSDCKIVLPPIKEMIAKQDARKAWHFI